MKLKAIDYFEKALVLEENNVFVLKECAVLLLG